MIETLIDHYIIYIYNIFFFRRILTNHGQNFISYMMQQFKETLKIKYIKTTSSHLQSNGNIERIHSTLGNLITTSIAENYHQWDENLKYINFIINATKNQLLDFHHTN